MIFMVASRRTGLQWGWVNTIVWSLLLELNFNLHTLITSVYRWPSHTTRWGVRIYGVSCSLQDVSWEPYSEAVIAQRAPMGLSTMCMHDHVYWLMRSVRWYLISSSSRIALTEWWGSSGINNSSINHLPLREGCRVKHKGNMNFNLSPNRPIIYLLPLCLNCC
jgi:hypothetical protein